MHGDRSKLAMAAALLFFAATAAMNVAVADGLAPAPTPSAPAPTQSAPAPAETPSPAPPAAPPTTTSVPPAAPTPPAGTTQPTAVTVLNNHEVQGILGREVVSANDENMGRIVDVIVDRSGQVRAAIIDFGGFLGVGSRNIAVDWKALHFPPPGEPGGKITLELTRDQVKAAPAYEDGKPVVVLGALGKLEPLPPE